MPTPEIIHQENEWQLANPRVATEELVTHLQEKGVPVKLDALQIPLMASLNIKKGGQMGRISLGNDKNPEVSFLEFIRRDTDKKNWLSIIYKSTDELWRDKGLSKLTKALLARYAESIGVHFIKGEISLGNIFSLLGSIKTPNLIGEYYQTLPHRLEEMVERTNKENKEGMSTVKVVTETNVDKILTLAEIEPILSYYARLINVFKGISN